MQMAAASDIVPPRSPGIERVVARQRLGRGERVGSTRPDRNNSVVGLDQVAVADNIGGLWS